MNITNAGRDADWAALLFSVDGGAAGTLNERAEPLRSASFALNCSGMRFRGEVEFFYDATDKGSRRGGP